MRIETFKHFVEVAQCGSFYRASQNLFISQQGLNKSICALEKELDCRLLNRSHGGVTLTDEGDVFMRYAQHMMDCYELMMSEIFESKHRHTTGETPIPLSISYYAAQTAASNPDYVHLLVNSEYVELPYEKLVELALDCAYEGLVFLDIHGQSIADIRRDPLLEFEPVIATRFGVVMKSDDSLAQRSELQRSELIDMPLAINTHCEMRHVLDFVFAGATPTDVRLGTTNPRMLLERVQAPSRVLAGFDSFGFYLAQCDKALATENMTFVPLDGAESWGFMGFLKRRDAETSTRARGVKRVLRQWLEEHVSAYLKQYPARKLWNDATGNMR